MCDPDDLQLDVQSDLPVTAQQGYVCGPNPRVDSMRRTILTILIAGGTLMSTAAAQTTPPTAAMPQAVVREVQTKLYDLNFAVRTSDGTLDAETDAAIRNWQAANRFPPTGTVSADQLARLRAQKPPSNWAALAFFAGVRETSAGAPNRREAETRALALCAARLKPGQECRVSAAAAGQCLVAAGYGPVGPTGGVGTIIQRDPTLPQAEANALAKCNAEPKSGGACSIAAKVCSGSDKPVPGSAPGVPKPGQSPAGNVKT
jgi:peptidoglycan hydrolase-like protein with peptidoglycan-binding domain